MKNRVLFKAGLLHGLVCIVTMYCKPGDPTPTAQPSAVTKIAPANLLTPAAEPTPKQVPTAKNEPAPAAEPKPKQAPPPPPAPSEPKLVHYPIVGIPNTGAHCWANAVLQVVHALYKERVYTQGDSPLKTMLLAMDEAIKDKKTVVERTVSDKFFDELGKIDRFHVFPKNNTNDSLSFLNTLNSNFQFMENMTLCTQYGKDFPGLRQKSAVQYNGLPKRCFTSNKHDESYDGKIYEYYNKIEGLLLDIIVVEDFRGIDHLRQPKRFNHDALAMVKIDPKFFKDVPADPVYLALEAFIVNTGGHWFSYIKKEHQWYCANDGTVSLVTENEFKNLSIVRDVLFYKKPTSAPNGANIPTIPAACGSWGE